MSVTAIVSVIAMKIKQPLIMAFIFVGILAGPAGPHGFNIIKSASVLHILAEIGLVLLLFIVGLKLDIDLIKSMGRATPIVGLGKSFVVAAITFGVCLLLKAPPMAACYLAAATMFSSTILVVKLLSDSKDADSLFGRISLGILISEDVLVIAIMVLLSTLTGGAAANLGVELVKIIIKGVLLIAGVIAITRFVFPKVLPIIARSGELLIIFGIAWAILLACVSTLLGFNNEVGAFIAGLSLATTMYREMLSAKLAGIRDFLLLFFFLELGSGLRFSSMGDKLLIAIIITALIIFVKPLIVMLFMRQAGYKKHTSFMTGITLTQISEFSLILVSMGIAAGHIPESVQETATIVLMLTMAISVQLITHSRKIYEKLSPKLNWLEKPAVHIQSSLNKSSAAAPKLTILIGLGGYGSNIAKELMRRGRKPVVVDFDPKVVRRWSDEGGAAYFGDASDPEFAHHLPLNKTRWVISSIRNASINENIIKSLRANGYKGRYACAVQERMDPETASLEADIVFNSFEDAASKAVDLVIERENKIMYEAMLKEISKLEGHRIICGYGRMGQKVAEDFANNNIPFVVVESRPDMVKKLDDRDILYVNGKSGSEEVLLKAGIKKAAGLISLEKTDEENVFVTLSARELNPDIHIVTRSIYEENKPKLRHAGADSVISPYTLGGKRIADVVLKPTVMDFLDIVIHDRGTDIEMAGIDTSEDSGNIGKTLYEITTRYGITILAAGSGDGALRAAPSPDETLKNGDRLVVMGSRDRIKSLKEALSPSKGTI